MTTGARPGPGGPRRVAVLALLGPRATRCAARRRGHASRPGRRRRTTATTAEGNAVEGNAVEGNAVGDDRTGSGTAVQIALGATPLDLPAPLGELVLDLVANRHGRAVIGHTDDHPWLFPGGAPGRHLGAAQLAIRLKRLDIPARASRNSALMELAAELPAKALSDLLGISLRTAVKWNEEAGNSRPAYAAHISHRRPNTTTITGGALTSPGAGPHGGPGHPGGG